MYFKGYNLDRAEMCLAALEYRPPQCKKNGIPPLRMARLALRGFRRLAGLLVMVGAACYVGELQMALAMLLAFMAYLRPGELLTPRPDQIIAPVRGSGTTHWALLLAPEEGGQSSKTHEFDESGILDWPIVPDIFPLLQGLRNSPGVGPVWRFTYPEYLKSFHRFEELGGISVLRPHPYSLRHGGASHDALTSRRGMADIKKHGRWKSDASVARYNKHARVLFEVSKIPEPVRAFAEQVDRNLAKYLSGAAVPPRPPSMGRTLGTALTVRAG